MSEQQSLYGHEAQVRAVLEVQEYLESQPTSTLPITDSLMSAAEILSFANQAVQHQQPCVVAKLGATISGNVVELQGVIQPRERVLHTQLFALGRFGKLARDRRFVLSHRHIAAPEQPYGEPTIRQTMITGKLQGLRTVRAALSTTYGMREVAPLQEIDYEDLFMALLCSQTARNVREIALATRRKTMEQMAQLNPKDTKAAKELQQRLDSSGLPEAPWAVK